MARPGQVFGDEAVRIEVLATGTETDGEVHTMLATHQPGTPYPPAHLHPDQEERFHVVEGEMTFQLEGAEHVVAAGESFVVPAGAVHTVRNAGSEPAVVRWETRPALRTGEFFAAMDAARRDGDVDALMAALEEYRDVFRFPG